MYSRLGSDWGTLDTYLGFPGCSDSKESTCSAGDLGLIPGLGRFPWRGKWQPIPVFLSGESYGQSSLAGHSPWGCRELDMTEWLPLYLPESEFPKRGWRFESGTQETVLPWLQQNQWTFHRSRSWFVFFFPSPHWWLLRARITIWNVVVGQQTLSKKGEKSHRKMVEFEEKAQTRSLGNLRRMGKIRLTWRQEWREETRVTQRSISGKEPPVRCRGWEILPSFSVLCCQPPLFYWLQKSPGFSSCGSEVQAWPDSLLRIPLKSGCLLAIFSREACGSASSSWSCGKSQFLAFEDWGPHLHAGFHLEVTRILGCIIPSGSGGRSSHWI